MARYESHTFAFYLWSAVWLPSQSANCRIVGTMLELEHTMLSTQCALNIKPDAATYPSKHRRTIVQSKSLRFRMHPLFTLTLFTVTWVRIARKAHWHVRTGVQWYF